jgi:hypothetical protein
LSAAVATPTATGTATALTLWTLVFAHTLQHFGACRSGRCLHDIAAGRFACAAPNGLATHGNRFSLFTGLRHEAFHDLDFNILFGKAFNRLHEAFFVQTHQIDGSAIGARTPGAANAVHIVFADVGNVVVHHMRQVVNVNAAGGNVGCHQGPDVAALEAGQRLGARRLAFVAVQGHGIDLVRVNTSTWLQLRS